MSILSLYDVSLKIADHHLLENVNWTIEAHDKIALVGRNGAGKSSLLKLLQGQLTPDKGQINKQSGLSVAGLLQEIPESADSDSVYSFLVQGLGQTGEVLASYQRAIQSNNTQKMAQLQQKIDDLHAWDLIKEAETLASQLGFDAFQTMCNLSGGMKRRVLLASALLAKPDLLLLDEPTNHLDIAAIEWLESFLKTYTGALLVVTHDRAFLSQVANQIVELDRGSISSYVCNYETYLDRREANRLAQDKQEALFDKRLAEEEVWIRTGIRARRTRNEGRVRALEVMRKEYQARHKRLGEVKQFNVAVAQSSDLVINATHVCYSIDKKVLLDQFSLLLTKGDKIGIIGPNGCGKTTLLRLLLGELKADTGEIKRAGSLAVAYFDQTRSQLDETQTVMNNVADGADFVTIHGRQKHVATYLRDFLFQPERFNQLVSTLSGGERNRLLLAKLLAKPVNLLVMDEPTNDLDIETLELLETVLMEYSGTLLLISHDREFIDNVVSSVLVFEGEGQFNEYVGGYKEYMALKKQQRPKPVVTVEKKKNSSTKLSFNEARELNELPKKIEVLEAKITTLQEAFASPDFYQQEAAVITKQKEALDAEEASLAQLYARWEELEVKG